MLAITASLFAVSASAFGWTTVFEMNDCRVTKDLGKAATDAMFGEGGIVEYSLAGRPYAYYKRFTPMESASVYDLMLKTWRIGNGAINIHHHDFEIYSTLSDAETGKNPWQFCNGNDSGTGFPRDCGPTGEVHWKWNAHSHRHACNPRERSFTLRVNPGRCWTTPTYWSDTDGDNCSKYARYGWCGRSWQPKYAVDGITADQACCECGGGQKASAHPNCKLRNGERMPRPLMTHDCYWYLCSTDGRVFTGRDNRACRRRSATAGVAPGTTPTPETMRRQEAEGSEDAIGAAMHQLKLEYERHEELQHIYDDAVEDLSVHLEAGSLEKTSSLQDAKEEAEDKLEEASKVVRDLEDQLEKLIAADDALDKLPSLRRF